MFSSMFNQTERVEYGKLKQTVPFASLGHWLARFNQFYKACNSTQVVSIAAFQAAGSGSIPGQRIDHFCDLFFLLSCSLKGQKVASSE